MWKFNGKHLIIDAVCSNKNALLEVNHGTDILQDIVQKIDMTMILPPISVNFPHAVCEMTRVLDGLKAEGLENSTTALLLERSLKGRIEQAYGYSTMVMIAESHLTMHTFPEENYLTFDCYSCKDFDHKLVLSILTDKFKISKINSHIINRGNPLTME